MIYGNQTLLRKGLKISKKSREVNKVYQTSATQSHIFFNCDYSFPFLHPGPDRAWPSDRYIYDLHDTHNNQPDFTCQQYDQTLQNQKHTADDASCKSRQYDYVPQPQPEPFFAQYQVFVTHKIRMARKFLVLSHYIYNSRHNDHYNHNSD